MSLTVGVFSDLFVGESDFSPRNDFFVAEKRKIDALQVEIATMRFSLGDLQAGFAELGLAYTEAVAEKHAKKQRAKNLGILNPKASTLLAELTRLRGEAQAADAKREEVTLAFAQLAEPVNRIATPRLKGPANARLLARLAEMAALQDVQTAADCMKKSVGLLREADILKAVVERANKLSTLLVRTAAAVERETAAVDAALPAIEDPLAKAPVVESRGALQAKFDKVQALVDMGYIESALAVDGVKPTTLENDATALQKLVAANTEKSTRATALNVAVTRKIAETEEALRTAAHEKANLTEAFIQIAAAARSPSTTIDEKVNKLTVLDKQLDELAKLKAWSARGADGSVKIKLELDELCQACGQRIAAFKDDRLKAKLQVPFALLDARRNALLALEDAETIGATATALKGEVQTFVTARVDVDEAAYLRLFGELSKLATKAILVRQAVSVAEDDEAAVPESWEQFLEKYGDVNKDQPFDTYLALGQEVLRLWTEIGAEVEKETKLVLDIESTREALQDAANSIKGIKCPKPKANLQTWRNAIEKQLKETAALTDGTRYSKMAEMRQKAEAFKTAAEAIKNQFDDLNKTAHEVGIFIEGLADRDPEKARLQGLLATAVSGQDARLGAAPNEAKLAEFVTALRDQLGRYRTDAKTSYALAEGGDAPAGKLASACDAVAAAMAGLPETAESRKILARLAELRGLPGQLAAVLGAEDLKKAVAEAAISARDLLREAKSLQLKSVVAAPPPGGGPAAIDALVAAVETPPTIEGEILCQAAIEARFGKKLVLAPGLKTKKLRRMYDLMKMVPTDHLELNKSLELLEFRTEPESEQCYYQAARKRIAFNSMSETEKPADKEFYDTATLHEVGHAVDDKSKVMELKKGLAKYGDWKTHNIDGVAEAIGTQGGFYGRFPGAKKENLKGFLVAVLNEETMTAPAPTDLLAALAPLWKKLLADPATKICEKITTGKSPWYLADAKAIAVGGRVYQEAYAGDWVSYALGERDTTWVSNYQWRAPAEWFAEIYATYYLDEKSKQKVPDIPVRKWLDEQTPL